MPKVIKQMKLKKPRGRPKLIINDDDDDVNELEKVKDDGNVIIQITWGPHLVEL